MWKFAVAGLATLFALLAATPPSRAAVNVVTTTPEIAALVREVGGDLVEVRAIAKPLQDPHYVDAKPSYMVYLNRAKALFYTGLELEIGWLPLLIQGARNPGLVAVDLSAGISVVDKRAGAVSRAEGDVHPLGNPHYWADPRNGAIMAATIADTLKRIDPAHNAEYDKRLAAFRERLKQKLPEWEAQLAPYKGTSFLDYHTDWRYFGLWAGLNFANMIEDKPGIPPTPSHVQAVMAQIARENVRVLLQTNYVDPKVGEFLARRTGIRVLALPATVEGEPGIDTWWDFFDHVVSRVSEALRQPA